MTDSNASEQSLPDILSNGSSSSSTLRARFTSPEIASYLTRLTSLPLSEIQQTPAALASEASQLTNSLTSLCTTEYPTFLALHRTSSVLSSTLSSLSSSLSSLISTIPALESSSRKFAVETHDVQDARHKARLVLAQHDALSDVLELPTLVDTCVRNAYYQEAMDLAAHARALATKFPNVAVVQDVAAETAHAMRLMLAQLLSLLRAPAKLPALFKAVSFLRKMKALDELDLGLAFLTSRLVNLRSILENVDAERSGSDAARYLKRYIDTWREGVHDVVSQYTTIFLERAPSEDVAGELQYLLSTFAYHMLRTLLPTLAANLSKVDDATSLTSLLTQLTHCSTSFARLGLDFRATLPPLFEEAVLNRFNHSVKEATDKFLLTISDTQKYSRQPSAALCTPAAVSSPPEDTSLSDSVRMPPHVLSSYPPLAIYTNAILSALNNLRLLAPASLLSPIISTLDEQLGRASSTFLLYCQVTIDNPAILRRSYNSDEEAPDQTRIIKAAAKVFAKVLIPYARKALIEGVFGETGDIGFGKELKDSALQWDTWLTPPTANS